MELGWYLNLAKLSKTFLILLNFMGLNLSSASDKVRRAHPTIQLGCIPNSLHSAAANSKYRSSF